MHDDDKAQAVGAAGDPLNSLSNNDIKRLSSRLIYDIEQESWLSTGKPMLFPSCATDFREVHLTASASVLLESSLIRLFAFLGGSLIAANP
jgi:hypothetical protein